MLLIVDAFRKSLLNALVNSWMYLKKVRIDQNGLTFWDPLHWKNEGNSFGEIKCLKKPKRAIFFYAAEKIRQGESIIEH